VLFAADTQVISDEKLKDFQALRGLVLGVTTAALTGTPNPEVLVNGIVDTVMDALPTASFSVTEKVVVKPISWNGMRHYYYHVFTVAKASQKDWSTLKEYNFCSYIVYIAEDRIKRKLSIEEMKRLQMEVELLKTKPLEWCPSVAGASEAAAKVDIITNNMADPHDQDIKQLQDQLEALREYAAEAVAQANEAKTRAEEAEKTTATVESLIESTDRVVRGMKLGVVLNAPSPAPGPSAPLTPGGAPGNPSGGTNPSPSSGTAAAGGNVAGGTAPGSFPVTAGGNSPPPGLNDPK
jgi:hypothetical protein